MIPLYLLSQPLFNVQFLNNSENTLHESEVPAISDLYSSFHNSIMPFSSLFQQSLYHSFYSKENSLTDKCYINIIGESVKIPIQVMNIYSKNDSLNENAKKKWSPYKRPTWSKFIVQSAVSRSVLYTAYDMLLCLPNDSKSDPSEVGLMKLNKSLCLEGVNLLLECVMDNGTNMPGLLTPVSIEAAVISVLYPPVNQLLLQSDCKNSAINSLKVQNTEMENNSCEIQNFKTELKTSPNDVKNAKICEDSSLKPFQMECMEAWFKPTTSVSSFASYIESKSSNKTSRIRPFYKMLQQSARNSKKLSSKSSKKHFIAESSTNSVDNNEKMGKKLPDSQFSSETENIDLEEMLSDLSYEDLLSTVRNMYDSAIEEFGNVVSSAKRIVKLVMNYYKKKNTASLEEDVQNWFKNNFIVTARKISEKYEMSDTKETTKKKIKECQIQVLLILEIENSKKCPDRPACVSTVCSLLRLMVFYSGIEDLQNFTHGVLINYSPHLYDILVEIGDELNISIFDDAESTNSPTDTVLSELMNEEDLFSSAVSSIMSEKSPSSINSRKDKDYNAAERKLLRRRSDISITTRCRQVILPTSASKKKKRKAAANKGVRCSPRIASKKQEHTRAVSEKPRTVRRNLFPGSDQTPKKNKNNQPSTPKNKKRGSHISKTKYVSETPSHKQDHSALQRRKSFINNLSDSPKEIAESPLITKSAKDGANKELLEKLQKVRRNTLKPTESSSQGSSRLNVAEYTPESKRRLSLKLFSKILASPTARMGIKKCTKRLFDQISPAKDGENCNKRHKSNKEVDKLHIQQ